ncbi:DUF58 domain-containing protein [Haladaptatus cibarius]|uniref:DUF58 domain-containing protein n=1 Tax=Haladaptatus cibarius TaxID=453847 RepID=UPI000679BFF3|nr:DUF58 domain-containing protein [Haladaptatus cibarius]
MLTRRGQGFLVVAILGVVMAFFFGARSLNAVVGPILVALVVGYVQLKRTSHPNLTVTAPSVGFRENEATITLEFSAPDPFTGRVSLGLADGLEHSGESVGTSIGETEIEYDVRLTKRGEQSIGPVRIVAEDVFGLFRRTFTHQVRETILVFPRIHPVDGMKTVSALEESLGVSARREFDQLREYQRGDPLRDVHWKSSAKRPADDLLIKEFETEEERQQIEITAEADGGRVDTVADAAASIASAMLDVGISVGLRTPESRIPPDFGDTQQTDILTLLAHMESGRVHDRERGQADIVIRGQTAREEAEIQFAGRTVAFNEFVFGTGGSPPSARADGGVDSHVDVTGENGDSR